MDLSAHDVVLKKYGWEIEHEFHDAGKWYVHSEWEGDIILQPEGQWQHVHPSFTKEEILNHGYNAKDLEKYLSSGEKTEKKRKNKSERLINLIKMIEIQGDYFGTEIIPYLLDAFEKGIDVDTKEKAIQYMEKLAEKDKYAIASLSYLKTLNDEEYLELFQFIKREIE